MRCISTAARHAGDRAADGLPARSRGRRHGDRADARPAAPGGVVGRPRPGARRPVPRLRRAGRRALADRRRGHRGAGDGAARAREDPHRRAPGGGVSARARLVLGVGALAGLAALLVWAVGGLPDFGHPRGPYADLAPKIMLNERHVTNTVTGVTFDLRGFDTLGEELILFVAALGATVLLRAQRGERGEREAQEAAAAEERRATGTADSLRALGAALVGPVLLLGAYIVVHGALTPGGGFQGGVILAGALLLVYAAGQVAAVQRVRPVSLVEVADAVGAASYALVALAGLVFGVAAMDNVLPLGTTGSLLSGGTVPVLSVAVGVEVTAAITLILSELVDQMMLRARD